MSDQDLGTIFGLGVVVGVAISALVSFLTDLLS
jgi:hypothetical protein